MSPTLFDSLTKEECKYILNSVYGINPFYDAKKYARRLVEPENVIFNDPATIVFWRDGTKTVVKCVDEPFDPEKGLAMAYAKKCLGNTGNYYNVFKKWLPEEEETDEVAKYCAHDIEMMHALREALNSIVK